MKFKLFIILLFLILKFSTAGLAQHKNTYSLRGYMGVKGGESFNYDLELKDSTGNYLSGYSYLYKTKGNEVKTAVIAEMDKTQKTLTIRENTIIYNNNFKSKAVICLVEASLGIDSGENVLKGLLTTQTINNGPNCSSGSIVFSNRQEIDHLFSPIVDIPFDTLDKGRKEIVTTSGNASQKVRMVKMETQKSNSSKGKTVSAPEKRAAPLKPSEITEGKDAAYEWGSDIIILDIWDGNYEDGDRVSVFFNEQEVLSSYTLKNERKQLRLKLADGINTITILALNEGGQPPNTANISIADGDKKYQIVANNKIGKKAVIKIRFKTSL